MEEVRFTRNDTKVFKKKGCCPKCDNFTLERSAIQIVKEGYGAERKIECIICGVVFYDTYKFDKLVFDGWKYGGNIRDDIYHERKDNTANRNIKVKRKTRRSNGSSDQRVDEAGRSGVGGKRGSKKGKVENKRASKKKGEAK